MRKLIIIIMLLSSLRIYSEDNYKLISYIPTDGEIQYLMNLYERLKGIESNEMDYKQLADIYTAFENKNERYYDTYQRLLFESYLLYTKNPLIKEFILNYISENNYQDDFSLTLVRLYNGVEEKYESNKKEIIKYKISTGLIDEQINLFNMDEVTVLNGSLGLMLFENDWTVVSIDNKQFSDNENNLSLVYGGGTNSIAVYIKEIKNISFNDFKVKEIDGTFYREKYSNYQVFELSKEGVLSRSGADYIFIGVGNDIDVAFSDIINFSSVLYLYSAQKNTGFRVEYFMNISKNNNNYKIRNALFNHLLFQNLLSFVN